MKIERIEGSEKTLFGQVRTGSYNDRMAHLEESLDIPQTSDSVNNKRLDYLETVIKSQKERIEDCEMFGSLQIQEGSLEERWTKLEELR